MSQWETTIVDDLSKVCKSEISVSSFVNKHWERYKEVYVNVYGYIAEEGDVWLLVEKFVSRIARADVQPIFQSDNQMFSYFKTMARNEKYDMEHKKTLETIPFSAFENNDPEDDNPSDYIEQKLSEGAENMEERLISEQRVQDLLEKLSKFVPEPCMQVVVLLYKGYGLKEIRKMLGISYDTVNDRLYVVRTALKEHFGITKDNLSWD